MMSNEPKAFPGLGQDGLTMRDYFAAKAMQGFCVVSPDDYKIADAMMRARGE